MLPPYVVLAWRVWQRKHKSERELVVFRGIELIGYDNDGGGSD